MVRCLQICRAYSFKLTRRHSTFLLLLTFIIILCVVFRLHTHVHHDFLHSKQRVGEFDYKPGLFLKGRKPQNHSFCDFRYGLPDTLNWNSITVYPSPQDGWKGEFRVIYGAIKGRAYSGLGKIDAVTYVTHATPEFLYHIIEIARFWDGPISLAVFVPNYDLDITIQILSHLCSCYVGMAKVSIHLFYPKSLPPKLRPLSVRQMALITTTPLPPLPRNITVDELLKTKKERYRRLNNKTRAAYIRQARRTKIEQMMVKMPNNYLFLPTYKFEDCSGFEGLVQSYRKTSSMTYPINVGRNVARNASFTNYFLLSDIEMIPSYGLAPKFLKMIRKLMGDEKRDSGCVFSKTVFVVPLFEVERGERIPHDKATLVQMVSSKRATYFHQKFCVHCQRFPGLQTWLSRPVKDVLEPMLIAKREYPYHRWEPLYFGTHKEPWYSEKLTWEGLQDKMTQMLELCLQEYRMVILDGGFLCHAASEGSSHRPYWSKAKRTNRVQYRRIIQEFINKYKNQRECRVKWGCS